MRGALVELTVHYGMHGEKRKTVALPISDDLARELMRPAELSNEPFSLMVASPGLFGGRGDAMTIRRKTFEMRREMAEMIAQAMVPELLKAFGVNDQLDGYNIAGMSPQEREWHVKRGRLPPSYAKEGGNG